MRASQSVVSARSLGDRFITVIRALALGKFHVTHNEASTWVPATAPRDEVKIQLTTTCTHGLVQDYLCKPSH